MTLPRGSCHAGWCAVCRVAYRNRDNREAVSLMRIRPRDETPMLSTDVAKQAISRAYSASNDSDASKPTNGRQSQIVPDLMH